MRKTYDFSFTEGYWVRSFRLTTDPSGERVEFYDEDSIKVENNGVPYVIPSEEEKDEIAEILCYAFETRNRRKDSRDVLTEVK